MSTTQTIASSIKSKPIKSGSLDCVLDSRRQAVDRVAARVTGRGCHFDSTKKIMTADQKLPIQVKQLCSVPDEVRSIIGMKFGRMTVLGLSFKPGLWVVRCACGVYTLRKAKSIRNQRNADDCCEECRHLVYLKNHDQWNQRGVGKGASK